MLVDLGRNDLGRVCEPGTVRVVEFGAIERFSHVMHIVSTVVGEVREGLDAVDVLAACYPAGTLTGAPKVRAMELIDELEPARRGIYGGGVGYLDFGGDLDLAIAIRTAADAGRPGLRPGGGGHRRRQRARLRRGGNPAQGASRAARAGPRRDAPAGRRRARVPRAVTEHSTPAVTEPDRARSLPRSAVLAALAIAAGVVVVLASSSPTWLRVTLRATHTDVTLTGGSCAGAAVPLALVAAAGLIAIALVRSWARRLLAVLIGAAGAGVLIAVIRVIADPGHIARSSSKVRSAGAFEAVRLAPLPYLSAAGALLIIAGALVALMYAGNWPAPTSRYERAAARAARPVDTWEALDRGEDPTSG